MRYKEREAQGGKRTEASARTEHRSDAVDREKMPVTEPSIQLFEKQTRIYPKRVFGRFRNLKWLAMISCLAIYYIVPFLRWNRGEGAPNQAVLIDLPDARAYLFGIEIWPQEVYILTGILIFSAIALFFVTSLFGRIWCGYFCFQTVWTDLFIWVERIIQGDRNKRKKLREGAWTLEKITKLTITHALWLIIALGTAGVFVLYFNDAPTLITQLINGTASQTVLSFMAGLTFMTYLMAGFAREQVCTYMCPYARFQSAMFDKDTLIITYDKTRGEPRGKHKKGKDTSQFGDCTDCSLCVQVCPMGIDIRDGLQMECIACGLCIDACDEVMTKLKQPKGLIRYDTENQMGILSRKGVKQQNTPHRIFRLRTLYYTLILLTVGGAMIYAQLNRSLYDLSILHDRNPVFVQLSNGNIRNGYTIKILNKTHAPQNYALSVSGIENTKITLSAAGKVTPSAIHVPADSVAQYKLFIQAPITPQVPKDLTFTLKETSTQSSTDYKTIFISERPNR